MGEPPRDERDHGRHSPPRARSFGQALAALILRLAGWRVEPFPAVAKAVVVGGPHTSNWDAALGLLAGAALGRKLTVLIKARAFRGPFGPILRRLGGMAIDRSRPTGTVEQAAAEFARRERLVMVVTPEGTRKSAPRWKTGFYRIAQAAQVPIVVAVADYAEKTLRFPLVFVPGGDLEAEMQNVVECFASVTPRRPENLSAPVRAARERKRNRHDGTAAAAGQRPAPPDSRGPLS